MAESMPYDKVREEKVTKGLGRSREEGVRNKIRKEWSGWWLQLSQHRGAVIHNVTW